MTTKTLVIYTGGTIGMMQTDEGLAPSSGLQSRIVEILGDRLSDLPEFDVLELSPLIDSSNITPANWSQIYDTLQQQWHLYSGFIVLHGTDTLAYSAAALSFMLGRCDKNVIFTGSQIPLGMKNSDADTNLESAMKLVNQGVVGMVTVFFRHHLLQGSRVTKFSSNDFSAFLSFNAAPIAELLPDTQASELVPFYDKTRSPEPRTRNFSNDGVGVLTIHPGLPNYAYAGFLSAPNCQAVILQTYGAGNIASQDAQFVDFIADMQKQGKLVINVTQCSHGGTSQGTYAAGSLLSRYGVLDGQDITLEAAFAKIHWLLMQQLNYDDIQKCWAQAIVHEVSTT